MHINKLSLMADPGFPRGGGANSPGGAPTYDFAIFSRKLHEIERIWAQGGERAPLAPPLDPTLVMVDRFDEHSLSVDGNIIRSCRRQKITWPCE